MSINANNKPNETPPVKCIALKSFYHQNCPTDKFTYNYRLAFLGLIFSLFTFVFFGLVTEDIRMFGSLFGIFPGFCYFIVILGLSIQLHYGFKIGDRKQFTPWIIFKMVELFLTLMMLIVMAFDFYWPKLVLFLVITPPNIAIFVTVFRKYINKNTSSGTVNENIYDEYDNMS